MKKFNKFASVFVFLTLLLNLLIVLANMSVAKLPTFLALISGATGWALVMAYECGWIKANKEKDQ